MDESMSFFIITAVASSSLSSHFLNFCIINYQKQKRWSLFFIMDIETKIWETGRERKCDWHSRQSMWSIHSVTGHAEEVSTCGVHIRLYLKIQCAIIVLEVRKTLLIMGNFAFFSPILRCFGDRAGGEREGCVVWYKSD